MLVLEILVCKIVSLVASDLLDLLNPFQNEKLFVGFKRTLRSSVGIPPKFLCKRLSLSSELRP